MKTFKFRISSPDGKLYEGEIVKISLRGVEGELAIMANHIPFVTSVVPCECRIELSDGEEKRLKVERGILSVDTQIVNLMSGSASWII